MFEIRVAVIGHRSVGKTTLINALFGAEYSEVSMRRTTAVVNSFRIFTTSTEGIEIEEQAESVSSDDDTFAIVHKRRWTANDVLSESKADNASYRNSIGVKEKTYDIYLAEALHEMRSDTKLVIVDIPGLNEAGTSSRYKDYVNKNWHNFDVVIVVMDARRGVDTDEQQNLLEFVKTNIDNSKKVPVIILCNKIDDPYDAEYGIKNITR